MAGGPREVAAGDARADLANVAEDVEARRGRQVPAPGAPHALAQARGGEQGEGQGPRHGALLGHDDDVAAGLEHRHGDEEAEECGVAAGGEVGGADGEVADAGGVAVVREGAGALPAGVGVGEVPGHDAVQVGGGAQAGRARRHLGVEQLNKLRGARLRSSGRSNRTSRVTRLPRVACGTRGE
jgi:hypothetical protein